LGPDGVLTAQVSFIQSGTLKLRPVSGATVTFMQNRRVAAQSRSGQDGQFTMPGLAPWQVYSVFVHSPEWFAAFSTYTRPHAAGGAGPEKPLAAGRSLAGNQLAFTADVQTAQSQQLVDVGNPIQAVPTGDFAAFMGEGEVPPEDQEGIVPLGDFPVGGMGGGFVGGAAGGAGGGAGGGGLGGGIGGALGAVGLALGIAALAEDDDQTPQADTEINPNQ